MRNYIILNGNDSRDVVGLLIQELAPISKPAIRNTIEEIDGRDGDIVTKLGYSAYDKEITVGLYGNYDVNDVIKYFDSEGTVVFSNEPDKYYKYQILDQIDYERLIRFRTATVRMHCQPFKYPTNEPEIEINATEVTGSGSNFTLDNTENEANFTEIKLNGNTDQTTYSGKNLFNLYNTHTVGYTQTSNGVTITFLENGGVRLQGTAERQTDFNAFGIGYWGVRGNIASILGSDWSGKTFTTSGTSSTSDSTKYNFHVWFFKNGSSARVFNNNQTWTAPTSDQADGLYIYITVENGKTIDVTWYPQIEKGSTATAFEPYVGGTASPNPDYPQDVRVVTGEQTITISDGDSQSQTYEIDLGDIELCKIGAYQDYIYKSNGTWYLHKEISKLDLATQSWSSVALGTNTYGFGVNNAKVDNSNIVVISDSFLGTAQVNRTQGNNIIYQDGAVSIIVRNTSYTSVSNLVNMLTANDAKAYYVFATPVEEEITNTDLLEQLDDLGGATTYAGTTVVVVTSDTTNNAQLTMFVKTLATEDYEITVTNTGNIYSKPKLTIYGIGVVGLYLDGNQIFRINFGDTTDHITIDTAEMEAYTDNLNTLRNRDVTGDYDNCRFAIGDNVLSFSGTIQGIVVENYIRWI